MIVIYHCNRCYKATSKRWSDRVFRMDDENPDESRVTGLAATIYRDAVAHRWLFGQTTMDLVCRRCLEQVVGPLEALAMGKLGTHEPIRGSEVRLLDLQENGQRWANGECYFVSMGELVSVKHGKGGTIYPRQRSVE